MAHHHKVKSTSTYCYNAPIVGAKYEPRAHGGVVHVDRCACGARRATNSTGHYQERGPWESDASPNDDAPTVVGPGLVRVPGAFPSTRVAVEGDRAHTREGWPMQFCRGRWVRL